MPGPANASTATSPNLGVPGDAETVAQMRRALGHCPHCARPIAVLVVPAAAGPGRRP